MRLIDADTLIPEFDAWARAINHQPKNNSGLYGRDEVIECVRLAPTIDAIPVEWIKEQTKVAGKLDDKDCMYAFRRVIDVWQMEQEAR